MSGSISTGKDNRSKSLQMIGRPLMTTDELKSMPKGQFIVMKTGTHPMISPLKLFFQWGISFEDTYQLPDRAKRAVIYMSKGELLREIEVKYPQEEKISEISESLDELDISEYLPKRKTIVKTGGG